MQPGPTPRRILAALAVVTAAALWLRIGASAGRELWFDDVARLRLATLSWDAIATRLPHLDNLKSPYLVGLHKLWDLAIGHGSVLAVRGWGILCGTALVPLAWAAARRVAPPRAALAIAAWFALDPFFVHWSAEVHNYAPAAALVLAFAAAVRTADELTLRRAAALGALGGAAVALFPPVALALIPVFVLLVLSSARPRRLLVLAGTAALVAAPALVSIRASAAIFAAASEKGLVWSPYFNPRTTPFEVLARFAGLDVRQGSFSPWMAAATSSVLVLAVIALRSDPARRDARALWRLRAALLAAGVLPAAALCLASIVWIGVFNDRYAHAALVLLPVGLGACVAGGLGAASRGARAAAAGLAAIAVAGLSAGLWTMHAQGDAFPRDLTNRSFGCVALVDRAAASRPLPRLLIVHGESVTQVIRWRSEAAARIASVRHLTTSAWLDALARGDVAEAGAPMPWGWPTGLAEAYGPGASVGREEAARRIAAGETVWLVIEHPALVRTRHLEDEETEHGLDAAWRLLDEPQDAARDARILAAVSCHLDVPPAIRVEMLRDRRAALFVFERR